jgi:hypothetical protein
LLLGFSPGAEKEWGERILGVVTSANGQQVAVIFPRESVAALRAALQRGRKQLGLQMKKLREKNDA